MDSREHMLKANFLIPVEDSFQPIIRDDGVVVCKMIFHTGGCTDIAHIGANFSTEDVVKPLESPRLLIIQHRREQNEELVSWLMGHKWKHPQ